MRLALVNKKTNIVENVAVPPGFDAEGKPQIYFAPDGYIGVMAEEAEIGWTHKKGVLTNPNPPVEEPKEEAAAAETESTEAETK